MERKVKYYEVDEISLLREDWKRLENGSEMSYFQKYDWYESVSNKQGRIKSRNYHAIYATVERNNIITLIAPLWIVRNSFYRYKKGVYFFTGSRFPDYLNFVYDQFNEDDVNALFLRIKNDYCLSNYSFGELKYPSSLYTYIKTMTEVYRDENSVCVAININKTFEEYLATLSKSTRQNIRTAFNRARKDSISFVFNSDDHQLSPKIFSRYRNQRQIEKGYITQRTVIQSIKLFAKRNLFRKIYFEYASWSPFMNDKNSHYITLKTLKGELCAAFNYGIDDINKSIVVMTVCTNAAFSKYSPGLIAMYYFIQEHAGNSRINTVDFTRGNEPYKYFLGGEEHFNKRVSFNYYSVPKINCE